MCHYACRSEVSYSTTTQSGQSNPDVSSAQCIRRIIQRTRVAWFMYDAVSECVLVCQKQDDSMRGCAHDGDAWRVGVTGATPPPPSLLSNEAGPQHAASFQQPRLNALCGSLLQVCTFCLRQIKWVCVPVHSISDICRSPRITWGYTGNKKMISTTALEHRGMKKGLRRGVLYLKFNFDTTWPPFSNCILTQLYKKN